MSDILATNITERDGKYYRLIGGIKTGANGTFQILNINLDVVSEELDF